MHTIPSFQPVTGTGLAAIGSAASITSAEIAELVGSRHDSVKRTIERLAEQGVISLPPTVEVKVQRERREENVTVFRFAGDGGKRDSIVVVAQLSPEFTARLVDRWQELEAKAQQPFALPQTMAEALRLAADQAERIEQQQAALAEQAPKVAALERFTSHDGKHNVRNAAKMLGIREKLLIPWMIAHDWMYRDHGGRLCAKAGRLADGCLDTMPVEIPRSDGIQTVAQPVITQKGLARLGALLARDGLLPRSELQA